MNIEDPNNRPSVPGRGQTWADGYWEWVPAQPGSETDNIRGLHWRWVRYDGKPCSVYGTMRKEGEPTGCMIFIGIGLAGLGGGIAGIASLFV